MSCHYLKSKGMTQFSEDFLLGHFFGGTEDNTNTDILAMVRDNIRSIRHPRNLGMFLESYSKRSNIKITRPTPGDKTINTLKCGVLILTGAHSPAVDDTVDLNSKLDPAKTTWMKISDASSLVLDEQPTSVTNAIVLFLQGYGHGEEYFIILSKDSELDPSSEHKNLRLLIIAQGYSVCVLEGSLLIKSIRTEEA